MSAPSISTAAATYGVGTCCPVKGTLTTQNVVTIPVPGSADLLSGGDAAGGTRSPGREIDLAADEAALPEQLPIRQPEQIGGLRGSSGVPYASRTGVVIIVTCSVAGACPPGGPGGTSPGSNRLCRGYA